MSDVVFEEIEYTKMHKPEPKIKGLPAFLIRVGLVNTLSAANFVLAVVTITFFGLSLLVIFYSATSSKVPEINYEELDKTTGNKKNISI